MKIVFTGSGSGGHFYPAIAVAEEVNTIVRERKLLRPKLYFIGPVKYDPRALYENNIEFLQSPAGKVRGYFSLLNVIDLFKTATGIVKSIIQLFLIYPDVVFSKGGYASFPTLVAARLLRIPVVIHESDAIPGRVSKWAGRFAKRIAISYPEAAEHFENKDRIALTGNPVRQELYTIAPEGGRAFLDLDEHIPTILILGGSQGAQKINDAIIDVLPSLVEHYQVIHQTGASHIEEAKNTASVVLDNHPNQQRYKPYDFLNSLALRMTAGAASLVISRAGSTIFEIALWGLPSIIIPIPENVSAHQRKNAFSYARSGAAIVIEDANLTPHVLLSEINRLIDNEELREKMGKAAKEFARPNAARVIAEAIVEFGLQHAPQSK